MFKLIYQKSQDFLKSLFRFLNSGIGVLTFLSLLLGFFIYWLAFFHPSEFKSRLSDFYSKPSSEKLSHLEEPVEGFGTALSVTKQKRDNKIYLDFQAKREDQSFKWINSVELKGHREGLFNRWEKGLEKPFSFPEAPSSLIMTSSDYKDIEIIAPTFDSFFIPVLNLVIYNKEKEQFELSSRFESYSRVKSR